MKDFWKLNTIPNTIFGPLGESLSVVLRQLFFIDVGWSPESGWLDSYHRLIILL